MLFRSKSGHTLRTPDDIDPRTVVIAGEPGFTFDHAVRILVPLDPLEVGCLLSLYERSRHDVRVTFSHTPFFASLIARASASAIKKYLQGYLMTFEELDLTCKVCEVREPDDVGAEALYQRLYTALFALQAETVRVNTP